MKRIILLLLLSLTIVQVDAQPRRFYHATNAAVVGIDADAQAFITITGISGTQATAINTLVIAAKAHGWWILCDAIYPFVGGTATTHKYNLKDPRDLDAAYRIVFSGLWTHDANGITGDGSTAYGDTKYLPNTTDHHISIYNRLPNPNSGYYISSFDVGGSGQDCHVRSSGGQTAVQMGTATELNTSDFSDLTGFYLATLISGTLTAYRNTSSIGSKSSTGATSTIASYYLAASNNTFGASSFSNANLAFATIGAGINSTIEALMSADISTYQTSIR